MLLLFLITALCASAAPNSPPINLDSKSICPAPDSANTRTVWSLVWSCLSIIFSCTWVAIHPNVPALEDSDWIIFKGKLGIFILAIVAPECIILWAMRQHLVARNFRDAYNRRVMMSGTGSKWTLTHGFFVVMGGFVYQDENGNRRFPIVPLKSLYGTKAMEDPDSIDIVDFDFANIYNTNGPILENEIKDRSKGDALSKLIVIFQLGWFATQVIARAVERLAITKLEVATAAYVLLSMLLYGIWWHKPKDVRYPVSVRLSNHPGNSPEKYNRQNTPVPFQTSFWDDFAAILGSDYHEIDLTLVRRLPTFFSGQLVESGQAASIGTELFLGSIFGAIHCAAWSFSFASHVERVMWQTSCVAVTLVPLLVLLLGGIRYSLHGIISESFYRVSIFCSLPVYVIGRLLLLAVIFSSLRRLPDGALRVVEWTTIIPHIG